MIEVQDTVEAAVLWLRNDVRNSKEWLLIAICAIEEDEDKQQMSAKRGKRMKGKYNGHKNNYIDDLSGKQRVKLVKIGGDS